jgi:hypothetical protein
MAGISIDKDNANLDSYLKRVNEVRLSYALNWLP